jgi:hypothetical protein
VMAAMQGMEKAMEGWRGDGGADRAGKGRR